MGNYLFSSDLFQLSYKKAQITDEAKIKNGFSKADATLWNGDVQIIAGLCEPQLGISLEIPVSY